MFGGIKYGSAVVKVLAQMTAGGYVDQKKATTMHDIAAAGLNAQYGKLLLRQRAVASSHAAAAAVFSRLAVVADGAPQSDGVSSMSWEIAARLAMQNAGATEAEATSIVDALKEQERQAGWAGQKRVSILRR